MKVGTIIVRELVVGASLMALPLAAAEKHVVKTPSFGEVTVACENADGWTFELASNGSCGCDVVTVKLQSPVDALPPAFDVCFDVDGTAVQHVWTCNWLSDAYHLWPNTWTDRSSVSQLASGTPIAVAFDGGEHARFSMACSEVFDKVEYSLLIQECSCVLKGRFRFFTESVNPLRRYEVKILLDGRRRFWAEAVSDASRWIGDVNGFAAADVPDAAFEPLYSTWYAYWQDVHAAPLEREAQIAAQLGMKTMILDDGWQKASSVSVYSATGDWMPVSSRFPDMKRHVEKIHEAGLKYMIWLSVPFVGDESSAWTRFAGKMLSVSPGVSPGRTGVLDPRFPEVREYLISTYERVVGEWGFDGVKLDFIDSFKLDGPDPAVKENYAGRDVKSVPVAVDKLMTDVLCRLKRLNPNVLVEFRQSYMGPAILKYGNMIRAADCPADPWSNRKRICDLRLTSGRTAVHSDMIVWNPNETPEGAALPILNALFATIQYSMILDKASASHREVIKHWIGFTQRHRSALLKGSFRPRHPESHYPLVEAEDADERIVAVYCPSVVVELPRKAKETYVINATSSGSMYVDIPMPGRMAVFDVRGKEVGGKDLPAGLQQLSVPPSGYLLLRWNLID